MYESTHSARFFGREVADIARFMADPPFSIIIYKLPAHNSPPLRGIVMRVVIAESRQLRKEHVVVTAKAVKIASQNQLEKIEAFRELHVPGKPIVLYNIWDAGSALAVAKSGAKAIATSSWAVAKAHGFSDGEQIPYDVAIE